MESYEDLDPFHKLEVLERWIHYTINNSWDSSGNPIKRNNPEVKSINHFFDFHCKDLQPYTRQYGLRFAKFCYYCGKRMKSPNLIGGKTEDDQCTVDHFFPRGHHKRDVVIHVMCCYACNQWKANRYPNDICHLIVTKNKLLPRGWGTSTFERINIILNNVKDRSKRRVYYLLKKPWKNEEK